MTATNLAISVPEGTMLYRGGHDRDSPQMCIMELVAKLTGDRWGDDPACVAPTLRRYCITLNDQMPDDVRQRLLPYVTRLIGTAPETAAVAQRRAYLCADRAMRVFAPLALEATGRGEDAARMRALAPIVDQTTARAGRKAAAYAAYAAAYAYAAAAAAAAAAADAAAWDEALRLLDNLLAIGPADA